MGAPTRFLLGLFAIVADIVELDLPNGTTKLVDNNQLTRNGQTVDRQVVNIGDPQNPNGFLSVGTDGATSTSDGGAAPPFRINNASPLVNIIKASAGRLCRFWCVDQTALGGITITFYDDPNGNTNNKIWGGTLSPDDILNLQCATANGLTC